MDLIRSFDRQEKFYIDNIKAKYLEKMKDVVEKMNSLDKKNMKLYETLKKKPKDDKEQGI